MKAMVLVLSESYTPLNIVSWEKAVGWLVSGRAVVEGVYADMFVCSPSIKIPLPSIIRFVNRVTKYFRKYLKFSRKNIWVRDKGICQYCGKGVPQVSFTCDHVIPKTAGGKTIWENIVVACKACNQKKKDRTPEQAGMTLLQKPFKPKEIQGIGWRSEMPEAWLDYLLI